MAKLNNENWVYDDDNTMHARKASEVLRRAKASRVGRRYKRIVVSTLPLTIIEKEDPEGEYLYGRPKRKKS